METWPR